MSFEHKGHTVPGGRKWEIDFPVCSLVSFVVNLQIFILRKMKDGILRMINIIKRHRAGT